VSQLCYAKHEHGRSLETGSCHHFLAFAIERKIPLELLAPSGPCDDGSAQTDSNLNQPPQCLDRCCRHESCFWVSKLQQSKCGSHPASLFSSSGLTIWDHAIFVLERPLSTTAKPDITTTAPHHGSLDRCYVRQGTCSALAA